MTPAASSDSSQQIAAAISSGLCSRRSGISRSRNASSAFLAADHRHEHPVRVHEVGVDRARAHGVDRDPRRTEFDRHRLRDRDHRGLGRRVGADHRPGLLARLARHVADPPRRAGGEHPRRTGLGDEPRTGDVDLEDPAELAVGQRDERAETEPGTTAAGDVRDQIDRAERGGGLLDGGLDRGGVGHVGADGNGATASRLDLGDEAVEVVGRRHAVHRCVVVAAGDVETRHGSTFGGEPHGRGPPDPSWPRRAGDQCDRACETRHLTTPIAVSVLARRCRWRVGAARRSAERCGVRSPPMFEFRPPAVVQADADLTVAFRRGDEDAVRELFDRYGGFVHAISVGATDDGSPECSIVGRPDHGAHVPAGVAELRGVRAGPALRAVARRA